jgi:hypothetical protein
LLLFFSFLFFSYSSFSQIRGCASSYDYESLSPSLRQNLANLSLPSVSGARLAGNQKSQSIIWIPVVVHVVHRNNEQNISDALIRNQIEILNNDFRRRNADRTNTPNAFSNLASDTEIQFYLACTDAQGRATSGITRYRTNHTNTTPNSQNRFIIENNTVAFDIEEGINSWDNTKYLNIYVADFFSNTDGDGILGMGHFPHQTNTLNNQPANATRSNVVSIVQIDYKAFGSGQTYLFSSANLGRTLTHEVGHWLALRHIWGDDQFNIDKCSGTDFVQDTPNQAVNSPFNICNPHPQGDVCSPEIMFMNYMDYSPDFCMNMFTNGQKTRMRNSISPNAPADVRRNFNFSEVYIESDSPNLALTGGEQRLFTLVGVGANRQVNWTSSPIVSVVFRLNNTCLVTALQSVVGTEPAWIQASVASFGDCGNTPLYDFRFNFSARSGIILGNCENPNFAGLLDKITCNEISGWAYNNRDQNATSTVSILVDNVVQTTLSANQYKNYYEPPVFLNSKGFNYNPPANAVWKDGQNHLVTIRGGCDYNPIFASQMLSCPSPNISPSINEWNPSASAATQQVNVTASASWSVSSDATTWLTTSNVNGSSFNINVTTNTGGSRFGIITITSGSSVRRINVTQGAATNTPGGLTLSSVYIPITCDVANGTKKQVTYVLAGGSGNYEYQVGTYIGDGTAVWIPGGDTYTITARDKSNSNTIVFTVVAGACNQNGSYTVGSGTTTGGTGGTCGTGTSTLSITSVNIPQTCDVNGGTQKQVSWTITGGSGNYEFQVGSYIGQGTSVWIPGGETYNGIIVRDKTTANTILLNIVAGGCYASGSYSTGNTSGGTTSGGTTSGGLTVSNVNIPPTCDVDNGTKKQVSCTVSGGSGNYEFQIGGYIGNGSAVWLTPNSNNSPHTITARDKDNPSLTKVFTVTIGHNCNWSTTSSNTARIGVVEESTHDEFENSDVISIYPNPVTKELILKTKNDLIRSVEIFDVKGQKLQSNSFKENQNDMVKMDVDKFLSGTYILLIQTDLNKYFKKFIKSN